MLTSATFTAMGTTVGVAVQRPADVSEALAVVRGEIKAIDAACSRFRADSELSRHNAAAGGPALPVSPLLEAALEAALDAARATGGTVDPTVGRSLESLGYTVTFCDLTRDIPEIRLRPTPAEGWGTVQLDHTLHTLRLPAGVSLDLGAVGKAWAADRAARAASRAIGAGVVVNCGGDVAVADAPREGWRVRVAEAVGAPEWEDVAIFDGGLATSGVASRSWRRGGRDVHHIVDPASGEPADGPWRMATVAAATCAEANAAATAAIVLGGRALQWLEDLRLPARLTRSDGAIVCTSTWPGHV